MGKCTMKWLELKIIPVAVVIICSGLMILTAKLFPMYIIELDLYKELAAVTFLLGIAVALAGVLNFKKAKTTVNPAKPENSSMIVDSGIYKLSRNPMYLGMFLALLALAIWLANSLVYLWLPIFLLYMQQFQIKPEERMLEKLFGEAFILYKSKVRRWI